MARKTTKAPPRTQWLFVQTARDAELVPRAQDRTGTLTLRGLERTIKFSDRPVRDARHETTKQFFGLWTVGPNSFAEDPPNAEIVIFNPGKAPSAATVTLSAPKWVPDTPNTLSYTAKLVGSGALPSFSGCAAALFIDTGSDIPERKKKQIMKDYHSGEYDSVQLAEKYKLKLIVVERIIGLA